MSDTAADDPTVTALLAMAEFLLSQRPLPVSEAVRCLLGVLSLQPVPRLEASVRLRLGLLLSEHTLCVLEAKEHLEKAMLVAGTAANLQGVRFHAASSLSALLSSQGQQHQARGLLRGKLEATLHHPYWHIRLLLQLADLLSREGDTSGQLSTLSRCADYSQSIGASHAHLLATLARGAVLLTHHNYSEAGSVLTQASNLLETYRGPQLSLLRTFYLTIQVTHLLMAGQVKTAKPHLKQLQQCVQSLSSQPDETMPMYLTSDLSAMGGLSAESFHWMTRPHAYITVYLVSVLHSVQAGFTDKALSYVDRAMQLINQEQSSSSLELSGVLGVLRTHVLEQSVQCLLMRGDTETAVRQLQDAVDTCHSHSTLVYSHRAVLHTLLGLYAFATSNLDRAITQFQTALQHTNCKELRVLVSLNLAISYMKIGLAKEVELAALMTSLNSEGTTITCQSLQSALSYVRGLFSFTSGRLHDAKRQLRETLTVANSSDLNKLTSCSLLLLGQIFLALGNTKETLDMVSPALQLSVKMPENRLQVWAASLLADLYHTLGEGEKERLLRQQSSGVLQQLERDEKKAVGSKPHLLLQWTNGEWPATVLPSCVHPASEDGGHEWVAGHTPPRHSSMTLNGSPVAMKTPEILLKRVESPQRATPPRSLLAMPTKLQTTPTNSQPPPTHLQRTPSRKVRRLSNQTAPDSRHLENTARAASLHQPNHALPSSVPSNRPQKVSRGCVGAGGRMREASGAEGWRREEEGEKKSTTDSNPGTLVEQMDTSNGNVQQHIVPALSSPTHQDIRHPPTHQDTHHPPGHNPGTLVEQMDMSDGNVQQNIVPSLSSPTHQDTRHLPPTHQDTHHPPPIHHDTHHPPPTHQDTRHLPPTHHDTHHPPPTHHDTRHPPPTHQDSRHPPPTHDDTRHPPPSSQDTHYPPPTHQDTHHPPLTHQDTRHPPPTHQDIHVRHPLPTYQDTRHPPRTHHDTRHPPPTHQDIRHRLPNPKDTRIPPPSHHGTYHPSSSLKDDKHEPVSTHSSLARTLPSQSTAEQEAYRSSHHHPHTLTHHQVTHYGVSSPHLPQTHSSPSHHALSRSSKVQSSLLHSSQSPRSQSSPSHLGHSPHANQSLHFLQSQHITPHTGQAQYVGQDGKLTPPHLIHHHGTSPLHQVPPPSLPSYEHSVHSRSPHNLRPLTPTRPGSAPSAVGPLSPKLYHLSPSHTPPPSRIPTHSPHTSPAHVDAAVEQHMLQTQQRLLWQRTMIQAQQNHHKMAQGGPYLQPVAPHPSIGHSPGLSPHYAVHSGMPLTPPQLTHVAALQQMSREPNRGHLRGLTHVTPFQSPVQAHLSGDTLHLLPTSEARLLQHHSGHQRR